MRSTLKAVSISLLFPLSLLAQGATQAPLPKVGDVPPDFTLAAATQQGISAKPVKLSDLKGRTVVIAFFPRQRTSGCTAQMTTYRNQYDSLFHGGKDVTLLGISTDSTVDLASWAAEAHFQFTFLSDRDGAVGKSFSTLGTRGNAENRNLFVVAPNGKISYVVQNFNPNDPMAYEAMGKAINDARGMK